MNARSLVAVVSACVALGGTAAFAIQNWSLSALLVTAICIVLAAPIIVRGLAGRLDVFEPIVMFSLAWAVMFVVRPAAMIQSSSYIFDTGVSQTDLRATFPMMLFLGLVGAIGFMIGYLLPWGHRLARRLRPPPESLAPDILVTYALGVALVGAVLFSLFLITTHIGLGTFLAGRSLSLTGARVASTSYFWQGPYLWIPSALILLEYGRRSKNSIMFGCGLVLAIMLVLRAIALGDRILLLPLLGSLFVLHYIRRDRRPRKLTIVGVLLVALIGSSAIADLRDASVRAENSTLGILTRDITSPDRWWVTLTAHPDSGEAPALALALTVIPQQVPHTNGMATVGDVFTRVIPRRLWPGKPPAPKERVIAAALPAEHQLGIANPEFTSLLAFYMDGGALGCLVGMIGYGLVARSVFEYYRLHREQLFAQLWLALSFPLTALGVRDGMTDTPGSCRVDHRSDHPHLLGGAEAISGIRAHSAAGRLARGRSA